MANSIQNKVVWLTGATSGIGEALAYALSANGAQLIISARREDELKRVAAKCKGKDVMILPLDLTDQSNFEEKKNQVLSKFNRIDILVNNGGISQRSLVHETPLNVDRQIMEVNYFGTIALTKVVLSEFIKQGGGKFVVTTSTVGKIGAPFRSGYSASKHALHGFFDALRAELFDKKVEVLLLCPGFIQTNVSVNALTEAGEKLGEMDEATANGMTTEKCAAHIIAAMNANKQEVVIAATREYMGLLIKRFFPTFFASILRKVSVR
jgi:short-subunit dehydrogenase